MSIWKDQVIIVTGASEGIGRAVCKALAPHGPRLVLAARNRERLETLKSEVEALGAQAVVVPTDVTDEAACKALVQAAVDQWGRIDTLINNAGSTMWARVDQVKDVGIFEKLMRLNYLSAVHLTYHALPYLKQSQGRIVAMSSGLGMMGAETHSGYCASKHALHGFFDTLRIELRDTGVSVTMIAPDLVVSEVRRRAAGPDGSPLGTSPIDESKMLTAEAAAEIILKAVENRARLAFTSPRSRFIPWLKVLAPGFLDKLGAELFTHAEH